MHLVGFIIRISHDARSPEYQKAFPILRIKKCLDYTRKVSGVLTCVVLPETLPLLYNYFDPLRHCYTGVGKFCANKYYIILI